MNNSDIEQQFYIPLKKRLLDDSPVAEVEECLRNGRNDVVLCTHDNRAVDSNRLLLENMSLYFRAAFNLNSGKAMTKKTSPEISSLTLKLLVDFFRSGEVTISTQNVEQVFIAARHFQVDCLTDVCKKFLADNFYETIFIRMILAHTHDDMNELGAEAAATGAKHSDIHRNTLLKFPGQWFAAVVKRNELRVSTEGEVAKLVYEWSTHAKRSEREILQVLECVRIPHLTPMELDEFKSHFEFVGRMTSVKLCLADKFNELPDEQLTRRNFYTNHVHLLWENLRYDEPSMMSTCLRSSDGKVVSHYTLNEIPEPRDDRRIFRHHSQFLTVMNSLLFVTYSDVEKNIVISKQQDDGGWFEQAKIPLEVRNPIFKACADRDQMILAVTGLFADSPDNTMIFLQIETEQINKFKKLTIPSLGNFIIKQMDFCDYGLILLGKKSVQMFNKATLVWHQMEFTYSSELEMIHGFVRSLDSVFLYGRRLVINTSPERVRYAMWKASLDTEGGPTELPLDDRVFPLPEPKRKEEFFVCCSKMFAARSDGLAQLDPRREDFSPSVDVRYKGKLLVRPVPSHVHAGKCNHRTILQNYCKGLHNHDEGQLLDRLAYYL